MWKKIVTLFFFHIDPTFYSLNVECLWLDTSVVDNWKIEEKVVHIAQRNQKRGVKEKSVNREKHEKDKMMEDSNTHGSEES